MNKLFLLMLEPELFLIITALVGILLAAFKKKESHDIQTTINQSVDPLFCSSLNTMYRLFFIAVLIAIALVIVEYEPLKQRIGVHFYEPYHDVLHRDASAFLITKIVLLFFVLCIGAMSRVFLVNESKARPEFFVMLLLATVGSLIMINASDFLMLYIGVELQSLALCVMMGLSADSSRPSFSNLTESTLKYFMMNACASVVFLFGISFIYGSYGSVNFYSIKELVATTDGVELFYLIFGFLSVISVLLFKLTIFPLHMWAPDVYEGAPLPVVVFLSTASKIAVVSVLIKLLFFIFDDISAYWKPLIIFCGLLSLAVGALGALLQENIKRLFAYSSIFNMGFVLLGFIFIDVNQVFYIRLYVFIYSISVLGVLAISMIMRYKTGAQHYSIRFLSGMLKENRLLSFGLIILLFSMVGMPPLAGFFAKMFIFLSILKSSYVAVAVIAALMSVVAAAYYLRLIKIICFDDAQGIVKTRVSERSLFVIAGISCGFVVIFFLLPFFIMDLANLFINLVAIYAG